MSDLVERLEERAVSYDQSGPSAQHTAALLREAKAEIGRLKAERDEWANHAGPYWQARAEAAEAEIERLREISSCKGELPAPPYDDSDFTPDLARKIIFRYQAEIERLRKELTMLEGGFSAKHYHSMRAKLSREIERLRKAVVLLLADKLPPEATFNNVNDLLEWLDK